MSWSEQRQALIDGIKLLETSDRLDDADAPELLAALEALARLRGSLDQWEPMLIDAARASGLTWAQLAPALGVGSRQAAERRYLRLKPQAVEHAGTTREHRVDAARNQRSGERAVADWARVNAARLRQLAGQLTALSADAARSVSADARTAIDRVRDVLGSDDAARLVEPLSDAARSLRASHPDLADQIRTLTRTTDEIRDADLARRTLPEGEA
ncbi:hypothetical protein ACIA58_28730 [Kribbella sp. NPDC051586]|uniref:hypothetical protein n=1 Tax=Kribbella sp. NPDC051586 TaxID=3364118 RepID=UPI0037A97B7C